jgi:hypothetical protein
LHRYAEVVAKGAATEAAVMVMDTEAAVKVGAVQAESSGTHSLT